MIPVFLFLCFKFCSAFTPPFPKVVQLVQSNFYIYTFLLLTSSLFLNFSKVMRAKNGYLVFAHSIMFSLPPYRLYYYLRDNGLSH